MRVNFRHPTSLETQTETVPGLCRDSLAQANLVASDRFFTSPVAPPRLPPVAALPPVPYCISQNRSYPHGRSVPRQGSESLLYSILLVLRIVSLVYLLRMLFLASQVCGRL